MSADLPVNIQGSKQSKDHQGISQDETEDQTYDFQESEYDTENVAAKEKQ